MAKVGTIEKLEEGKYLVTSVACPECGGTFATQLSDTYLYGLQRGESASTIFAHLTAPERERFISGYCGDCWNTLFSFDEDED